MCERQRLMRQIQICDFALTDVGLYLNSHPTCPSALAYYHKYKKMRYEAICAYEAQFGPLSIYSNENADRWTWVENPWPWEMEA